MRLYLIQQRLARLLGACSLVLILNLTGCSTTPRWGLYPPASPQEMAALDLNGWLAAHPLAAGDGVRIDELGRTEEMSFHLVQVRTQEPVHYHKTHESTVIILRGKGTLDIGSRPVSVGPGDIVTLPKGQPHAFYNEDDAASVAYVIFSPPFDGKDRVLLKATGTLLKTQPGGP